MKKQYCFLVTLIVLGILVAVVHGQNKNEFEILNSYIVSADNFQSVSLQVVVNVRSYDDEEMLCKVRDFYYRNHGVVDELKVDLYESKWHLKKSCYRVSKTFSNVLQ